MTLTSARRFHSNLTSCRAKVCPVSNPRESSATRSLYAPSERLPTVIDDGMDDRIEELCAKAVGNCPLSRT